MSSRQHRRWEEAWFTITAANKGRTHSYWQGESYKWDVPEHAKLQGFPDEYKGLTVHGIGNSVPPELARAWGKSIRAAFGGNQQIVSLFCGAGGFDFIQDI